MVGKFAYDGIKAFLTKFFEPGKEYSKEYIQKAFNEFYDETGMRLEYYNDDYDMVTFMRNKIYLIIKNDKGLYSLSIEGESFRKLLLSDEEKFKIELFKWIYNNSRTRFRSLFVLVERLKQWLTEKGPFIKNQDFQMLITSTIGKHKFNEGVISLLEALGLFNRTLEGFKLNGDRFTFIFTKEERSKAIYSILKLISKDNKIQYKDAIAALMDEMGTTEKESGDWLKELEKMNMLIIRSTRGGVYIEL